LAALSSALSKHAGTDRAEEALCEYENPKLERERLCPRHDVWFCLALERHKLEPSGHEALRDHVAWKFLYSVRAGSSCRAEWQRHIQTWKQRCTVLERLVSGVRGTDIRRDFRGARNETLVIYTPIRICSVVFTCRWAEGAHVRCKV